MIKKIKQTINNIKVNPDLSGTDKQKEEEQTDLQITQQKISLTPVLKELPEDYIPSLIENTMNQNARWGRSVLWIVLSTANEGNI